MIESLTQLRAHGLDLGSCGDSVEAIHVILAQRSVADERADIHRWVCLVNCGGVRGECGIPKIFRGTEEVHRIWRFAPELNRRGRDPAIAHDHRRHSLRDLGKHLRIADDGGIVVRVCIDKAGRECEPVRIHS